MQRTWTDRAPLGVFFLLVLSYLPFPTAAHSYDGVAYAMSVERAFSTGHLGILLNEYHILYHLAAWGIFSAVRWIGIPLSALLTLQVLNSLAGAALGAFLCRALLRLGAGPFLASGSALLLGWTAPVWFYSTDAETYPLAGLFLVLAMPAILGGEETPAWKWILAAGLPIALAIGFHAANVLMLPVAALSSLRRGWQGLARAAGVGLVVACVLSPFYLGKWVLLSGNPPEAGLTRLLEVLTPAGNQGTRWFLAGSYRPDREALFLATASAGDRTGTPAGGIGSTAARTVFGCALLSGIALSIRAGLRKRSTVLCLAWLALYFLFFSGFNPESPKFFLFVAIPAVALLPFALSGLRPAWILPAGAAILGLSNLLFFVLPQRHYGNEPRYGQARFVEEATAPEDCVVLPGGGPTNDLKVWIPYFGYREVLALDFHIGPMSEDPARGRATIAFRIRERIRGGNAVYLVSDIVEGTAPPAVSARETLQALFPGWRVEPGARLDPSFGLYRLLPP